ncbi:hypothetical protein [Acidihalobacter aeolianus]|uniref:hypothetical protein n=1 Tax=Acidihalobacter aeolianus TaxID=2792603 RepID=UPI0012EAA074|nr:hypothetical protein [Acidihalobacter aeolianus]
MTPYSGNLDQKTLLITLKSISTRDNEGTPSGAIYEEQRLHGMSPEEHEVVMSNLLSEGFTTREYIFGNPVYRLTEMGRHLIEEWRDRMPWPEAGHESAG